MSCAGCETARSTPLRSVIVPRSAGSGSKLSCCVRAALRRAPLCTVPRYSTRSPASASRTKTAANIPPIRRWTSATGYSPVPASLPPALVASPEPDDVLAGAAASEPSALELLSLGGADSEDSPPSELSLLCAASEAPEEDSSLEDAPAELAPPSSVDVPSPCEWEASAVTALPTSARGRADRKLSLEVGAGTIPSCAARACTRVAADISEFSIASAAFSRCSG